MISVDIQAVQSEYINWQTLVNKAMAGERVAILKSGVEVANISPVIKIVDNRQQDEELAFNRALQAMPIIDGFDDKEIFMRVDSDARQIDWSE
ncbi:MAG: hypothetical protein KGV51_04690 [Moraxellaceae bacterium]|nr:hypothetical protein [Moraxellaceae bacterium]